MLNQIESDRDWMIERFDTFGYTWVKIERFPASMTKDDIEREVRASLWLPRFDARATLVSGHMKSGDKDIENFG